MSDVSNFKMMAPTYTRPFITVCTPTYNRGGYLSRVYESLSRQDFREFEWIVVDDGSSDETAEIMDRIIADADFSVVYIRQENSGKHIAVNRAVERAKGELFTIVDSDDACDENMLGTIHAEWAREESTTGLVGMAFLTKNATGEIVGTSFPHNRFRGSMPHYFAGFNISGDKCDVHVTAIFRANKFPETPGEKFCPEALLWNRFSREYDTVFVNKAVKIVEYLPDGLSANIVKIRAGSPQNTTVFYDELCGLRISFLSSLKACINLFRFAFHGRRVLWSLQRRPMWAPFALPAAFVFFLRDRRLLKKGRLSENLIALQKGRG